ncbi:MAG TPA: hypothetical protein VHB98_22925 [Chloroflexota bacterium]|jgi:hypothetical protein|nr:hypothetical protein [Chloroflexota bacterium]
MRGSGKPRAGTAACLLLASSVVMQPSAVAAQGATYVNQRYGFSITLPKGWPVDATKLNGAGVVARYPGDASATIQAFGYTPGQQDLRKDVEARVYTINHVPRTIHLLPETIANQSALRLIYYATVHRTQSILHLETYLHAQGHGYAVICEAAPKTYVKIQSSCLAATNSLRP